MKKLFNLFIVTSVVIISMMIPAGCSDKDEFKITVQNQTGQTINDVFVTVSLDTSIIPFLLYSGESETPYQVLEKAEKAEIGFVTDLGPNETKVFTVKRTDGNKMPEFKSRTYAELSMKPGNVYIDGKFRGNEFVNVTKFKVPSTHTDHDALFRYEGPGWESEKVGYRFYLDWRNANDIFGKKVEKLLLSTVGVHDTVAQDDSYHSMQDWGMDIFNVGKSLGIGSIGMWSDGKITLINKTDSIICEIPENGPVLSSVKTSYYGWQVGDKKYDLVSTLSIAAGSRLTHCAIDVSDSPDNITTGLVKHEAADFITSKNTAGWSYIALYGKQTLVNKDDELGIVVIYRKDRLKEGAEDSLNYFVKLIPDDGRVEYYFCAAWDQEPGGIKTKDDFIHYLDNTIEQLDHPVVVKTDL